MTAFKRSLKKKDIRGAIVKGLDPVDEKGEFQSLICKLTPTSVPNPSPSKSSSEEKENSPENKRKDRKCDDDIDYEDENKSGIKKRSFIKTSDMGKNDERTAAAFQNSFGKIRKSKTSTSSPRHGVS